MNKNKIVIKSPKGEIIGLVISFIESIIESYILASIIINISDKFDSSLKMSLFGFSIPIFFVLNGVFLLIFLLIVGKKEK